jgi:SNF2 family DNA or RNA helicase
MISMVCDHRVLLTGTPIQNNTTELWALLNFVDPREFSSMHSFQGRFGTLTTSDQVTELHAALRPFLLRRMKEDGMCYNFCFSFMLNCFVFSGKVHSAQRRDDC